jgi:acyl-CoA reductase-like NAD-dependent aldehyde dehydrogenase
VGFLDLERIAMAEFSMTIDGEEAATEKSLPVTNPATGEVFAEAPEASRAQVDQSMLAAARAFETWQYDRPLRQKSLEALASAV